MIMNCGYDSIIMDDAPLLEKGGSTAIPCHTRGKGELRPMNVGFGCGVISYEVDYSWQ